MTLRTATLRLLGGTAIVTGGLAATGLVRAPAPPDPVITVYKSPTCGCCGKWIEHLRAAGFTVVAHDTGDLAGVRTRFAVPFRLTSCHTAHVGGYVIEGHVPADLIQRLLAEHAALAGLAVPGMVAGSPGMEGLGAESYDVVAWDRAGKTRVYAQR